MLCSQPVIGEDIFGTLPVELQAIIKFQSVTFNRFCVMGGNHRSSQFFRHFFDFSIEYSAHALGYVFVLEKPFSSESSNLDDVVGCYLNYDLHSKSESMDNSSYLQICREYSEILQTNDGLVVKLESVHKSVNLVIDCSYIFISFTC